MLNTLTKTILDRADVAGIKPDLSKLKIIARDVAEATQTLIFDGEGSKVCILTTNKFSDQLQKILANLKTNHLEPVVYYTDENAFSLSADRYTVLEAQQQAQAEAKRAQESAAGTNALAMIKALNEKRTTMPDEDFLMELIRLSFQSGASDLHFQPEEAGVIMRVRIDGVLQTVLEFSHEVWFPYLQKLKLKSGTKMNIDYLPQDGRFGFEAEIKGQKVMIDVRINFMPGIKSESTVMRYLDSSKSVVTFDQIGFEGDNYEKLMRVLSANYGMALVTGPTGSGKTTTLYTMLHHLNDGQRKIITLEDPVEYTVAGIQQSQINYAKWYDYAQGLKACLRHDPEVILVGETRDLETAQISINAALTGHLVFTTLHTNSAIESISRILSMGVESYMLAPAIVAIFGQRLARKVCPHCVTMQDANFGENEEIKQAVQKINDAKPSLKLTFDGKIPHANGCDQCNHTGYKGRIALLEVLEINDTLKTMIIESKSTLEIYAKAREAGYMTLKEDGIVKMLKGMTTLDELRRVA